MDILSTEDRDLHHILERYMNKLKMNTLTCEEKLNLVNFYICDTQDIPDNLAAENYLILGWYVSTFLQQ